jgi:hypothetical protein
MRVLIACEFSGIVREAFKAKGHDTWSCDLLDTEIPGQHIKNDVRDVLGEGWDLMVAHPECTYLAVSGARWFSIHQEDQEEAIQFVRQLWKAPIPKICIENPVSVLSTKWRRPDQIIQPYQFGHEEQKTTCLWLKHLPKLQPTSVRETSQTTLQPIKRINRIEQRVWKEPPSPERWKNRSRTLPRIAEAMAQQWG